jgi:hypothetical protein
MLQEMHDCCTMRHASVDAALHAMVHEKRHRLNAPLRSRCVCFGRVVFSTDHEFHYFFPYDVMPSRHVSVIYSRRLVTTGYPMWSEFQFIS